MKLTALLLSLTLVGCATPPQWLASFYNDKDGCQSQNWHRNGGTQPSYCGAGSGRTVIYSTPTANPIGAPVGYTKSR